ncbi:polysaccharide biosynthesis tyrosine autokinase [uncultured Dokdonia sp.]|uniref:GumC family protein n=1 Tax=Dokdonia sp. R78006 TaxID=3093866 RepID=UPI00261A69F0|nr:polysaccharide biosynthesis tyrosine autokinase [uncultured Dokdonia sp.]
MQESTNSSKEDDLNIKEEVLKYLKFWPIIIFSFILSLTLAFLYLKFATHIYESQTTILIKDQNNSAVSELAAFDDLGIGSTALSPSSFDNEIEIIKSKRLLGYVVDNLELTTNYIDEENLKYVYIYKNIPFKVLFSLDNTSILNKNIYIKVLSKTQFAMKEKKDENSKTYNFGERIVLSDVSITVVPTNGDEFAKIDYADQHFVRILYVDRGNTVNRLQNSLSITQTTKYSSVLRLSIKGPNKDQGEAILNNLITVYNEDAINDRNLVSKNTANFIDNRLSIITAELDSVETDNVKFRERNEIINLETEGRLSLLNANELVKKRVELNTQVKLFDLMTEYLKTDNQTELLPTNTGIALAGAEGQLENYNTLILERNRLLQNATELNPVVVQLTSQIESLKDNILNSLKSVKKSFLIQKNDLNNEQYNITDKLSTMPNLSKGARDIARQQGIKESLYLYLLKKREETAISLAVATPKAKIVDRAYSLRNLVSPQKNITYLKFGTLGLLIPLLLIYLKELFDTKIHNRDDVERYISSLSFLGEIPILNNKDSDVITANDRSVLAEIFRIIRTNIAYVLKRNANEKENVIFVTSAVKGEGKTFVAYNLALTLNSTSKSVLLIGADIRNPQLHRYIDKEEWNIGLSEYLNDSTLDIETITNRADGGDSSFDLILSGHIPPNPAELLINSRFDNLIDEVKSKYDYVIVDTAPTLLVTDTLLISQKADMTVYVSRANYTDKKLIKHPKELIEEGKLKNVAFIINGVKMTNLGYGSQYGYGYGLEEPSLMKRIKQKLGIGF